jgi:hypothetical protein
MSLFSNPFFEFRIICVVVELAGGFGSCDTRVGNFVR